MQENRKCQIKIGALILGGLALLFWCQHSWESTRVPKGKPLTNSSPAVLTSSFPDQGATTPPSKATEPAKPLVFSPAHKQEAMKKTYVELNLNQLNDALSLRSAGKMDQFEEIKTAFSEEFAMEMQNISFLTQKPIGFAEVHASAAVMAAGLLAGNVRPGAARMLRLKFLEPAQ